MDQSILSDDPDPATHGDSIADENQLPDDPTPANVDPVEQPDDVKNGGVEGDEVAARLPPPGAVRSDRTSSAQSASTAGTPIRPAPIADEQAGETTAGAPRLRRALWATAPLLLGVLLALFVIN